MVQRKIQNWLDVMYDDTIYKFIVLFLIPIYCIFLTIKFQQTQKDKYWKGDKISGNYGKREKIANEKIETVENVKCNICDLIHPPTI